MRKFTLFVLLALTILSCKKEEGPQLKVLQGDAFGTTYTIQYFTSSNFNAEQGIDSIFQAVNNSVSTYLPNSDISKINAGDSTVVVDEIFRKVYRISERVHEASGGMFDPTVGVLRNAYGFGDEKPIKHLDETMLDSLRKFVGFKKVKLTKEGTIKKEYPEIYFDFNAVAKGYGIDLIGDYLKKNGVANFIIELGGEVLAHGTHLSKQKIWTAGVESADSKLNDRRTIATVMLDNSAMAASGNYRKFRVDPETGKKYVHTINPITGKAEETNVTSATVIAPTCAIADAYATAFMALGIRDAKQLLKETPDVEAYFTYQNDKGESKTFISGGFTKILLR